MRLPSVLALLSLAVSAAADCAIMTADYNNFNSKEDFQTNAFYVCEQTLHGKHGSVCLMQHRAIWRLICHGVAASSASGGELRVNYDKKPGDACGLNPGEVCK